MKTSTKVVLITVVVAVPAFFLGNIIWPASPDINPTGGQVPLFIFLAALEAIALGIGVAFLVFCWKRAVAERIVFLAVAWLLISWWAHDNMHKANGLELNGLLVIEYVFHATLIVTGFILVRYFWKKFNAGTTEVAEPQHTTQVM